MIISVSRRTDIPSFYSEWFFQRIKAGFVDVRNPMNAHQISRIDLSPDVVDAIVFWTKNPAPMTERLGELSGYPFYFQFTLTGYGRDVEANLPDKREQLIPAFQNLSRRIGKERVIWRYDPILLSSRYTVAYHEKAFREIAGCLRGYTEKVVISFLDFYDKTERNLSGLHVTTISDEQMYRLAASIAAAAAENGMIVETCAESVDLEPLGIRHGCCIDRRLIERITGSIIKGEKDKNQRKECGCLESVDIGCYNTCMNGCKYCYANFSQEKVQTHRAGYRPESTMLCGEMGPGDRVTYRAVTSLKDYQLRLPLDTDR